MRTRNFWILLSGLVATLLIFVMGNEAGPSPRLVTGLRTGLPAQQELFAPLDTKPIFEPYATKQPDLFSSGQYFAPLLVGQRDCRILVLDHQNPIFREPGCAGPWHLERHWIPQHWKGSGQHSGCDRRRVLGSTHLSTFTILAYRTTKPDRLPNIIRSRPFSGRDYFSDINQVSLYITAGRL